ncbi:MAG TPA: hypothetical protein VN673_11385 [Clostridia bacterium]|nr:hypothetical protein [Clostridia bacterium]
MNTIKTLVAAIAIGGLINIGSTALAAEQAQTGKSANKAKVYPLKTCAVTGEKLGEMGKPYEFTYQDREIKFCCKGCLKDFNKEPAKYVKKLEAAEKTAKTVTPSVKAPAHGQSQHHH